MTKYIHYKKSMHTGNILVSDRATEEGWHLYSEIECGRFNEVLASVIRHEHKSFHESIIECGSVICITSSIMSHLEIDIFKTVDYKIKIHQDGIVLVYSRNVE